MKGDPPKVIRMNLNVDANLHNAFKVATVMQGKPMTDVIVEFMQQYVQKHYPAGLEPKKGRRP